MAPPPLRYGIVGAGMMGLEHVQSLAPMPDAQVVAVADPHPASQNWARMVLGEGPEIHSDNRELLARDDLDVVVIATPNHTHRAVFEQALDSGLHLFIEKPLCTTLEDCRFVVEHAAHYPGRIWVGLEYRYMPPVARMVEEVRAGRVGRLRMLAIREHRFPFLPKVNDWNRFTRNTGGTLVEKCCHFFDLMHLIVGAPPTRVYASGAQDVNHLDERYDGEVPDILDNAYVIVDFAGGARAQLDLCMFAEGSEHQEELVAVGDAGKLEAFLPSGRLVMGRRHPRELHEEVVELDPRVEYPGFHHGATTLEHLAFQRALRNDEPVEVGVNEGLWSVATGVAAQTSIHEGRPVDLAELGVEGD
ncbi:Gfo/Idh/MocA family oxidoreductase [Myxococcota bacterium]|nr:Gfo/Idh/MocA family oxidoreductase [Myxococcota bacterium]